MMAESNGENVDQSNADGLIQDTSRTLRSVFLSVIVMATLMTSQNTLIFSSIAVPQMDLSLDEMSWYNSLPTLTGPVGTLFIAFTIDKYGRRIGFFFSLIPNTVGWFVLADKNAPITRVYLGRLLLGLASGASHLPAVVYVAECITVNHTRMRSTVGTWAIFSSVIGGLLMYTLSLFLSYNEVAFVFSIASVVSLFSILIFIPESPAWLYQKGRIGDAEIAEQRLGIKQPILRARKVFPTAGEKKKPTGGHSDTDWFLLKSIWRYVCKIRRRDVYVPVMVTLTLHFGVYFSGIYSILTQMIDMMSVYPLESSSYVLSLAGQVIQTVGCALLTILMPLYGIRRLSVVSFLGVSAGFLMLAFSVLYEDSSSANIFNYLHIVSVWAILLACQLGMLAVHISVLGELFPMDAKGYATIPLLADTLFGFTMLRIIPYALDSYRVQTFFVFSVISAVGGCLVVAYLPETVGRTMDEINESFTQPTTKNNAEDE